MGFYSCKNIYWPSAIGQILFSELRIQQSVKYTKIHVFDGFLWNFNFVKVNRQQTNYQVKHKVMLVSEPCPRQAIIQDSSIESVLVGNIGVEELTETLSPLVPRTPLFLYC
jgi:hypothetical protein